MTFNTIPNDVFLFKKIDPLLVDPTCSVLQCLPDAFSSSVVIKSFSSNLGTGGSESSVDLEVVWDQCDDQLIIGPNVGDPVIFKCGNFEFGGIVDDIKENQSTSGMSWNIKISDPRKLLDSVQLLLDGYYCPVNVPNIFNVQNLKEGSSASLQICNGQTNLLFSPIDILDEISTNYPNLPEVGGPPDYCNYFGTSKSAYNNIYTGKTNYYTSLLAIDSPVPNKHYPIVYTSNGISLQLDLTNIIYGVASTVPYAGTDSTSVSLLDFITSVCNEAGYDFNVSLGLGFGWNNSPWSGLVLPRIVFNVINRKIPGTLAGLNTFIQGKITAGTLISSSAGIENSYAKTKKIVIGDNVKYIRSLNNAHQYTKMVVGKDPTNGAFILADGNDLINGFDIDLSVLFGILQKFNVSGLNMNQSFGTYKMKETEVLSLANKNFWLLYSLTTTNSIGYFLGSKIFGSTVWNELRDSALYGISLLNGQTNPNKAAGESIDFAKAKDRLFGSVINNKNYNQLQQLFEVAYDFLVSWKNEFYGVKWHVTLPQKQICYRGYLTRGVSNNPDRTSPGVEGGTQSTIVSDEITDAGWIDPYSLGNQQNILGLVRSVPLNSVDTALFETSDGRLKSFIRVPMAQYRDITWTNTKPTQNTQNIRYNFDPSLISKEFYFKNINNIDYIYTECSIDSTFYRDALTGSLAIIVDTPFLGLKYFRNNYINDGLKNLALLAGVINPPAQGTLGSTGAYAGLADPGRSGQAAGQFDGICIPFKSNMYVYGPWASSVASNDPAYYGGTEIIKQEELNPWTYGSLQDLNIVGASLANDGLQKQIFTTSGSAVVAELPSVPLGQLYVGTVLNSVVVNFGSSGISTTYNFQSFSQKFGNYSRNLSDRIKQTNDLKKEVFNNIKSIRQKNLSVLNRARIEVTREKLKKGLPTSLSGVSNTDGTRNATTPVSVLYIGYTKSSYLSQSYAVGNGGGSSGPGTTNALDYQQICQGYIPTTSYTESNLGAATPDKRILSEANISKETEQISSLDSSFMQYGIMSLDGIFAPVSLYGSTGLPRFASTPNPFYNSFKNKPRPVMPPVSVPSLGIDVGTMIINNYFLNPIVSTAILDEWSSYDDRANDSTAGFSITNIGYGNDPYKLFNDSDAQENVDFRFNALKGPLVLQAWGYDTEGKPIPNAVDSPANCANGSYTNTGLQDKFMRNWQGDPRLWPVGPIDLRWDRQRGVWVAPPSEKLVVAQLLYDLNPLGSVEAVLFNPSSSGGTFYQDHDVYGPEGQHITGNLSGTRIYVNDFLGRKLCKGTVIYAYHYGQGKYLALETSIVADDPECLLCDDSSSSGGSSSDECEDICGLLTCFETINGGPLSPSLSGVLGIASGCLTIYPLVTCGAEEEIITPIPI